MDTAAPRRATRVVLLAGVLVATYFAAGSPASAAVHRPSLKVNVGTSHAPVRAVIRAPLDAKVHVRLNGQSCGRAFRRRGLHRRVGLLGANDGVRHGRNRLHVIVINGERRRSLFRRFRIAPNRAIAGAGRDRVVTVGSTVRLNGGSSRLGPGEPARDLRWRVVRAPRGSHARVIRPHARRPSLRVRRPGTYVIELNLATDRRLHRVDTVTIVALADDPPIGVRLNTLANANGQISIAGSAVPGTGGGAAAPISVAILDRTTRKVKDDKGFSTTRDAAGINKVQDAVDKLGGPQWMVIVNGTQGIDPAAIGSFASMVAALGGPSLDDATKQRLAAGQPFSIVGIAKGAPGAAFTNFGGPTSTDPSSRPGALAGYLQLNTAVDQYGFVFGDYAGFNTQLSSSSFDNTMQIGGATADGFLEDFDGEAGFQVVVVDRRTLEIKRNQTFPVDSLIHDEVAAQVAMAAVLRGVTGDELAFVQSIGRPQPTARQWDGIAQAIARLGGTRSVFNSLDGSGGYALIGTPGLDQPAPEASYPLTHQNPASLAGVLQRERDATFDPMTAVTSHTVNNGLLRIAYQTPTPFPNLGGKGPQAAAVYIANKLNLHDPDIRKDYYLNYEADWDAISGKIPNLPYPKTKDFTKDEYVAVRSQLGDEAFAVATVKHYIKNLQSPFTSGLTSYVDLQDISNTIISAIQPPDQPVGADTFSIMSSLAGIASIAEPPAGQVAGVLSGAFGIAATLSGRDGASLLPEINARTSQLAKRLVDSYADATNSLAVLGQILVSDYGKLTTVARLSTQDPAWKWPAQGGQIPGLMRIGAKQVFYSELMPAAWALYDLSPVQNARDWHCYFRDSDGNLYDKYPFSKEPDSGQYLATVGFTPDTVAPIRIVQALGAPSGAFVDNDSAKPPPASLTDPLFKPVNQNGLGLFKPWFFRNFNEYPQEVPFDGECR